MVEIPLYKTMSIYRQLDYVIQLRPDEVNVVKSLFYS